MQPIAEIAQHMSIHNHYENAIKETPRRPSIMTLRSMATCLLLGLEVVEEDGTLLGLLTPVLNDDARAVDNLAGVALAVKDAYSKQQSAQFVLQSTVCNPVISSSTIGVY